MSHVTSSRPLAGEVAVGGGAAVGVEPPLRADLVDQAEVEVAHGHFLLAVAGRLPHELAAGGR